MTAITVSLLFVLHTRPYRETSLLVEVFSHEHGRLGLVAKGARRGHSPWAALLQPFAPLRMSYSGRSTLKTLNTVEALAPPYPLAGTNWLCAYYLNELLLRLCQPEDPHPLLLEAYHKTLAQLAAPSEAMTREAILRYFETTLLQEIGYGLPLTHDVSGQTLCADARYHFDVEQGFRRATDGTFSGATLKALHTRQLVEHTQFAEAKALLRRVIDWQLAGQVLQSRLLLKQISAYQNVA